MCHDAPWRAANGDVRRQTCRRQGAEGVQAAAIARRRWRPPERPEDGQAAGSSASEVRGAPVVAAAVEPPAAVVGAAVEPLVVAAPDYHNG